ncbi:MAG: hypothetical protein IKX02_01935, partial [Spirochaetales bacterium]|nr:hypothetical protein [Spirochaetales bacterium]
MKNFVSSQELVERLEALKKGFVPAEAQPQPQYEESQAIEAQPAETEDPAPKWDINFIRKSVIDSFKKKEPFLASALDRTGEWTLQNGKVTIPCPDSFQSVKVEESVQKIESAIAELTGQNIAVEVVKPQKQDSGSPSEEKPAVSPSVEMVKKVFKGEIV